MSRRRSPEVLDFEQGGRETGVVRLLMGYGEPFLESADGAKRFGIYFPGESGPEDSDGVCHAVKAHAVFGIVGGLLEPQDFAAVGFFGIDVTVAAGEILKFLEFFHGVSSLRALEPKIEFIFAGFPASQWPRIEAVRSRKRFLPIQKMNA
jgi:hypothetical protein